MSAEKNQTQNNQQKVFDRLAVRFKEKIRETVSDNEAESVDTFLKQAYVNSPLRYSSEYNEWLFSDNTRNPRYIAWDGDKVVGTQYGLDCTINYADKAYTGCCAIDLSVNEKWRMKGLGVALIKKLMDQHDFVIGLGISQAAQAMFARLEWHNLGQVTCHIKPLTSKGFSSAKQNQGLKSSVVYPFIAWGVRLTTRLKHIVSPKTLSKPLLEVSNYSSELAAIFSKHQGSNGKLNLKKDCNYFQWRFLQAPSKHSYNIHLLYKNKKTSSYLVTMIGKWQGKQVLAICDYLGPESDYPALVKLSEELALSAKVDAIMYQGINSTFEQALRKSLFVERPHGDLFMLFCNNEAINSEAREARNWHITFSDSDMDFMFFQP